MRPTAEVAARLHLRGLVRCREPQRIHNGSRRPGLHRSVQAAAAQQAHPGCGRGGVLWQAGQAAVDDAPGGVKLEHVGLAQQSDALQTRCLHRRRLVRQALLGCGVGGGEGRRCGVAV